jgi:parallel beta-helix repeat protein
VPLLPVTAGGGFQTTADTSATSKAPPRAATHPPMRASRPAVLAALLALVASVVPSALAGPGLVAAGCPSSLQKLIDATPSGGTLSVPACVFHESIGIGRPITIHAAGATVDGDNTRTTGVMVQANNVTIDGLTVQNVRPDSHVGAVNLYYGSGFTFQNGTVRNSSTVCLAMHMATGARVLDSDLGNCGKEGYFLNGMSDTLIARNRIHNNNMALAFDWGVEAGGGKTMASDHVTFDSNEVYGNRGPGIWFDGRSTNATITNNRVHDNDREGIFFEVSKGARIAGNSVWGNGFGFAEWGYGAGILVSSSDGASVDGNTVAWNARGISVISQARDYSPHDHDTVTNNVIVSAGGAPLAGFYDDHGGTLYDSANANAGSGNRYWAGVAEPSANRFMWSSWLSTLGSYNATRGEEGGTYLSTGDRDNLLTAAGMPTSPGGTVAAPAPLAGDPRVTIGGTTAPGSGIVATISWHRIAIADAWQLQVQKDGGAWTTVRLSSSLARAAGVTLAPGHTYRAKVRLRYASTWSPWVSSSTFAVGRAEETSASIAYGGRWTRIVSEGASARTVKYATGAGASALCTFAGRAIAWISPVGPTRGYARVYIDGRLAASVNLHRSSFAARRIVFRTWWTSTGTHTIKVVGLGTAGHPRVDVDAFGVIR